MTTPHVARDPGTKGSKVHIMCKLKTSSLSQRYRPWSDGQEQCMWADLVRLGAMQMMV